MPVNIEDIVETLKSHVGKNGNVEVIDESQMHHGHAGYNPEIGTTHIGVSITWSGFDNLNLLDKHRLVNSWLEIFFNKGLHAARYNLKQPEQRSSL